MSERSQENVRAENPHQEKFDAYIRELLAEKSHIDEAKFPHAYRLIDEELQRAQATGRAPFKESKFVDVYRERPVKVSVKVLVPTKEHPRYNFIGKILGQKGNTLKQLQEETMCYISICGRGSIRDRQKEEELRQSLEPKYAHLHDDLHVDINTIGPPAEAHARIAFALAEIRKYLIPEYGDSSRQEVLMDLMSKPKGQPMRESLRESIRDDGLEGPPVRKPVGILRNTSRPVTTPPIRGPPPNRARAAIDDYEEEYNRNGIEYDEYSRSRPSTTSRTAYPTSRGNYRDDYESHDYYRESSAAYSASSPEFGYKKRKTFMD
ncbi:K Homology domain containing protein [Oryctes borbonicus]|uniref:K Homology domain containing protein n=1 Tax=Oryctes borbonicus TaxID=1629725 RepID=A0A0T6B7C8_9SCAR|nr:K Homology domain containing protein [Oryctes borbonicus]